MGKSASAMSVISAIRAARRPGLGFVLIGLFWGAFAAQVPTLKSGIGASDALFGVLLLGTGIGLVSAMLLAPAFDRIAGGRALQASAVVFGLSFVPLALAQTPAQFFAALLAVGLASGLTDILINARTSELEAASGRPLMNAVHGVFSASYAVSAVLTGFAREAGWSPLDIFSCVTVAALALSLGLAIPPAGSAEGDRGAGRFPWAPVAVCGAIVFVAFLSEATVESWSALHVERTLGGSAAEGAFGPATLGLTMAFGRFAGQAVSDRFSEIGVILTGASLAAAGALTAAAAPTPAVAYLGFGTLGLGVSVVGPIGLAIAGRAVPPVHRTRAISVAAVMGFSGFFAAPGLMGVVSEFHGLRAAFASVALLALALWPLAAAVRRQGS